MAAFRTPKLPCLNGIPFYLSESFITFVAKGNENRLNPGTIEHGLCLYRGCMVLAMYRVIYRNPIVMKFSELSSGIFWKATETYHVTDQVDAPLHNPYELKSIEYYLYLKNWIDAVQWHLEDIIRNPEIDPAEALAIKRRIDRSNQERTDLVELIDSYFLDKYKEVAVSADATINTESPAWAVDRLSILILKIYHMRQEADRADADAAHKAHCKQKLAVLLEQRADLSSALDQLLDDIAAGRKYMKVYKQMKMYNDPALNPVLYAKK